MESIIFLQVGLLLFGYYENRDENTYWLFANQGIHVPLLFRNNAHVISLFIIP